MADVKEKEDKVVGMSDGKTIKESEAEEFFDLLNKKIGVIMGEEIEKVLEEENIVHPTSPDWLHTFIPIPEEKGAKEHSTNSNNFHRHHVELSKVISQLQAEIEDLKFFKRMVMSRYPEAYWCKVEKYIRKIVFQEDKIKQEQRRLEVLKKERSKVHYKV